MASKMISQEPRQCIRVVGKGSAGAARAVLVSMSRWVGTIWPDPRLCSRFWRTRGGGISLEEVRYVIIM